MIISLVTGGFDPLHSGHLALIRGASLYGDVCVGLNSDDWLYRKKGYVWMPFGDRKEILQGLTYVDRVIGFNDKDDSACEAIYRVSCIYDLDKIVFCNGGDRTEQNIPEMNFKVKGVELEFAFGVGGTDKIRSSSSLGDK